MSDDLISRRELLEELKDFRMSITGSTNATAFVIMDQTKKSIMKIIEEQPIAYDIDKIINKIEMSSTDKDGVFIHVDKKQVITKKLAIEIVKSGGVADE